MCGIAGFVTLDRERVGCRDLVAMSTAIEHRGPDDDGLWCDHGVGLAHRRLAVLDLTLAGHQPMRGPGGSWITYNGEVYNFREIAAELARRGVVTRTRCDTEVILLALEQWGLDALPRLNGMFAFGHWDPGERVMTLVRDRLGVKPLYYYADNTCLVFASELRAIERWQRCPREIDPEALDLYISYEHVPAPYTMRAGVRKLEPGCLLQWHEGRYTIRRWWDVTFDEPEQSSVRGIDDYAAECRERLRRATSLRLVSDAPLGALLSGGLDSSAVVSLMADLGHVPQTFSIGFSDASYDELPYSRTVADHVGAARHEQVLAADANAALSVVDHVMDEPLGDVSIIPTHLVSAMARREVTVALTGDGGDEVFAGYDWYRAEALATRYARVPGPVRWAVAAALSRVRPRPQKKGLGNKLKRFTEGAEHDPGLEHLRWQLFAGSLEKRALYRGDLAPLAIAGQAEALGRRLLASASAHQPLSRQQWVDLHLYLPDDINAKVDRASMAVALETRSPFLDVDVVEFAARLPAAVRFDGRVHKRVLRQAIAPLLPAEMLNRRKEGFSVPMKHWLGRELVVPLRDALLSPEAARWFDQGSCRRLIDEHVAGRRNHAHLLWPLLVFMRWQDRFGGDRPGPPCPTSRTKP
jgi:asparagine synthase (glutamine-hydrolysing)